MISLKSTVINSYATINCSDISECLDFFTGACGHCDRCNRKAVSVCSRKTRIPRKQHAEGNTIVLDIFYAIDIFMYI